MTTPVYALLGFASWTVLVLVFGIGLERWSLILRGRAGLADFPADTPHGSPMYRRATRAHANCTENLPVFTAIVFAATQADAGGPRMDALALAVLVARVGQTLVHVGFEQTNRAVGVRFSFFAIQLAAMCTMGVMVGAHAF